MVAHTLRHESHVRRFTITDAGTSGWEVLDEQDSELIRRVRYTDWHRVERARMMFARVAASLRDLGWVDS
jgi:hypothetical protein